MGILSFLLSEQRYFLCNDSLINILTQDSESGWVTLKDKEGENYRVNMAEKVEEYKAKKAKKTEKESKKDLSPSELNEKLKKFFIDDNDLKVWHDRNGKRRIYIKQVAKDLLGIKDDYYKTGNLKSFEWEDGQESNSYGRKVLGVIESCYYDMNTGKIVCPIQWSSSRELRNDIEERLNRNFLKKIDVTPEQFEKAMETAKKERTEKEEQKKEKERTETNILPPDKKDSEKESVKNTRDKFNEAMSKIDFYRKLAKGENVDNFPYKDTRNRTYIAVKTKEDLDNVANYVKDKNITSYEDVKDYIDKEGVTERFKEVSLQAEKFHDKFYGKDYWNGQIYTYKNGDRAVFLNGNRTVLTDDEYTYLKV